MKEIKRRLMSGYVELMDGTFAKEVNGELIPVHEDEACAFEEDLYFDDDDNEVTKIERDFETVFEGMTIEQLRNMVRVFAGKRKEDYDFAVFPIMEKVLARKEIERDEKAERFFDVNGVDATMRIYVPVTTKEMVEQEIKEHEEMFRNMSDDELEDWINRHATAGDYDNPYYMMAWDELKRRGLA